MVEHDGLFLSRYRWAVVLCIAERVLATHLETGGTIASWIAASPPLAQAHTAGMLVALRREIRARDRVTLTAALDGYERRLAFLDEQRAKLIAVMNASRAKLARLEQPCDDRYASDDEHDRSDA